MNDFTLTTPALLFSAISLILLAYTNRFLVNKDEILLGQIANLRRRLYLTKNMQIFGVTSLFLCVCTMFLIYTGYPDEAFWVFGVALLLLIVSLGLSILEIQISVKALDLHLSTMEGKEK